MNRSLNNVEQRFLFVVRVELKSTKFVSVGVEEPTDVRLLSTWIFFLGTFEPA